MNPEWRRENPKKKFGLHEQNTNVLSGESKRESKKGMGLKNEISFYKMCRFTPI